MSRFLRFTVEKALEGAGDELKEYLIGAEVFDRRGEYDPRVDPIVRVEARRLRAKLETYYETEGRGDEILIEYPIGGYVPRISARQPVPAVKPAPASGEKNVAVLPFTNLSADPENEYFSDGLTEELIHRLTKVEGLRVVAWQSASQLRGKSDDLQELGERLGVGTVLGGSVRRAGDRLRVTAQLVSIADGRYLWTETYERRVKDVFDIQDEISRAIVETLRVRLVDRALLAPSRRQEYDLAAYNLYLRGRFHWNKRTPDDLRKGIQFFERAIGIDPELAVAYAGLADSYSLLADYGFEPSLEAMPKARAAAERALETDPTLGEAHVSLGLIRGLFEWRWPEAESHYRRAVELNPGYATAHHWYAMDFLAMVGRFEEAQRELETALSLDPLSLIINEGVGYLLMLRRMYDEAIQQHYSLVDLDPYFYKGYTAIGRVSSLKGDYGRAVEMLRKGREMAGDVPSILGALGQTLALAGRRAEARQVLEELAALAECRHVSSSCFALIHAGLGENERALDWLELGCENRELSVTAIRVHPAYDSLRSEPRFAALLSRIWPGL